MSKTAELREPREYAVALVKDTVYYLVEDVADYAEGLVLVKPNDYAGEDELNMWGSFGWADTRMQSLQKRHPAFTFTLVTKVIREVEGVR